MADEMTQQTAPQQPIIPPAAGSNISAAFQRVPQNPNAIPTQSVPNDAPADEGAVTSNIPSTPSVQPAIPTPGTPAPTPQPTAGVPQTPPVQTAQQQMYQPYYDQTIIQQMQQEREALRREIAARDEAIRQLSQDASDLQTLRRQQEAANAVSNIDFSQFQTVDEEEAKKISQATIEATQPQFDYMKDELAKQRQMVQQSIQQQQQQLAQMQQMDSIRRVLAAHPDYYELQHTPEYQNFMRQRDGLSSQTYDQRAAVEFQNGNVEYVIDLLNKVKGQRPNVQQVQSVPPVQTAAGSAVPAAPQEQLPTLHELNNLIQTRQITHDQYREMLNKLRAAQNQPMR